MDKFIEDTLRGIFGFIGDSVRFVLGLIGVVTVTALSLSGEVLDDITTYKGDAIPWPHIAKVVVPPCALAVAAYLQHVKSVASALATTPPTKETQP